MGKKKKTDFHGRKTSCGETKAWFVPCDLCVTIFLSKKYKKKGEFSAERISLEEIEQFYHLNGASIPKERPYVWCMTVGSTDSLISFNEPKQTGCVEISLGHIPNSGSGSDFRLLQAGWMYADAIVGTGEILRREDETANWILYHEDLIEHRVNVLKKKHKQPINVILTSEHFYFHLSLTIILARLTRFFEGGKKEIDVRKKILNDSSHKTLIVTTKTGAALIKSKFEKQCAQYQCKDPLLPENGCDTEILVIEETKEGAIDVHQLLSKLKHQYGVECLDLTAGGETIGDWILKKVVDEHRLTIAGHLMGSFNSLGEARPRIFNLPPHSYFPSDKNPLLEFFGIRIYGNHLLFLRNKIKYRH